MASSDGIGMIATLAKPWQSQNHFVFFQMTVRFYLGYLECQGEKGTIWIIKQRIARKRSFISNTYFLLVK